MNNEDSDSKTNNRNNVDEFPMKFKQIFDGANLDQAKHLTRNFNTAYSNFVNTHGYTEEKSSIWVWTKWKERQEFFLSS